MTAVSARSWQAADEGPPATGYASGSGASLLSALDAWSSSPRRKNSSSSSEKTSGAAVAAGERLGWERFFRRRDTGPQDALWGGRDKERRGEIRKFWVGLLHM